VHRLPLQHFHLVARHDHAAAVTQGDCRGVIFCAASRAFKRTSLPAATRLHSSGEGCPHQRPTLDSL